MKQIFTKWIYQNFKWLLDLPTVHMQIESRGIYYIKQQELYLNFLALQEQD